MMVFLVRPLLARALEARRLTTATSCTLDLLAIMLLLVLCSAGSPRSSASTPCSARSSLGVVMPQRSRLRARRSATASRPQRSVLLLPLFFAYTGLRTQHRTARAEGQCG